MKQHLLTIVVFLAVCGLIGGVVVVSGLPPVKASTGHWAITEFFLSFAMKRSVATHSRGIEVPDLNQPELILIGAGHYERGCRQCHGSPDHPHPRVAAQLTPHPPYLKEKISEWDAKELFYITKHGVMMTGMPAFPSQQRDDEVWAVVAFLLKFPELDAAKYKDLVFGNEQPPEALTNQLKDGTLTAADFQLIASCARCHGYDGQGRMQDQGEFPHLAQQSSAYLTAALTAYAQGERHSGIMEPLAAELSEKQIDLLSNYFAQLPLTSGDPSQPTPDTSAESTSEDVLTLGETIAQAGLPEKNIPACVECHGPDKPGTSAHYPDLAGQPARFLVQQLERFHEQQRGGSSYAQVMQPIANRLNTKQREAVAAYYSSLKKETRNSQPFNE